MMTFHSKVSSVSGVFPLVLLSHLHPETVAKYMDLLVLETSKTDLLTTICAPLMWGLHCVM